MRVTDPDIMALSYKPEGTLATEETDTEETDTGVGQFENKRVKILPRYLTIIPNTIRIAKIRPTIAPKNIIFTIYFSFF